MNPFTAERERVIAEALTWIGTPYHHMASVKGSGASCSTYIATVFNAALGLNLHVVEHAEQWYLSSEEQKYLNELRAQGFVEVEQAEAKKADLVISKTVYTVYCHGAILLDWPKPAPIIHVSRDGVKRVASIWGSWHFAGQVDTHRFFSWGGWH